MSRSTAADVAQKNAETLANLNTTLVEIAQRKDIPLNEILSLLTETIAQALSILRPMEPTKNEWGVAEMQITARYENIGITLTKTFMDIFLHSDVPQDFNIKFYRIFTDALIGHDDGPTYPYRFIKKKELETLLNGLEQSATAILKRSKDNLKLHMTTIAHCKEKILASYENLYKTTYDSSSIMWIPDRQFLKILKHKTPKSTSPIVDSSELEQKMRDLLSEHATAIANVERASNTQEILTKKDEQQQLRIKVLRSLEAHYQSLLNMEKALKNRKAKLKNEVLQAFELPQNQKIFETQRIFEKILRLTASHVTRQATSNAQNHATFFQKRLFPTEPPAIDQPFTGKPGADRSLMFDKNHCPYNILTKNKFVSYDSLETLKTWLAYCGAKDRFQAPDIDKKFQTLLGSIFKTHQSFVKDISSLIKYKKIFNDAFKAHCNPDTPEKNIEDLAIFERYINTVSQHTFPTLEDGIKIISGLEEIIADLEEDKTDIHRYIEEVIVTLKKKKPNEIYDYTEEVAAKVSEDIKAKNAPPDFEL